MVERELEIVNKRGLHARAAARFVQMASVFESHVTVIHDGEEADGKSILSLMVLGASVGTRILIRAEGADEEQALEKLGAYVGSGCAEQD